MLTGDQLDARDTFFFGLVSQHRASDHVSDGIDAGHIRPVVAIGHDESATIPLDPDLVETEALGIGDAAGREQNAIRAQWLLSLDLHDCAIAIALRRRHLAT